MAYVSGGKGPVRVRYLMRAMFGNFFEAVTKRSFAANWATYKPGIGKTGVCDNHVSGYWDGGAIALCDVHQE